MTPQAEFFQRDRSQHPPALTPDYKTSVLRSPRHAVAVAAELAVRGDRSGVRPDDLGPLDNDLILQLRQDRRADRRAHHRARPGARRERPAGAEHAGRVLAGQCRRPLPPQEGHLSRADRSEFRRLRPHADRRRTGYYYFRTVKPGPYPWRNYVNNWRPAHIHFSMFGSGFAQRLITQMYFEGDPLIPHVPDRWRPSRTRTARRAADRAARSQRRRCRSTRLAYQFDIVLRGRRSTLFENRLEGN